MFWDKVKHCRGIRGGPRRRRGRASPRAPDHGILGHGEGIRTPTETEVFLNSYFQAPQHYWKKLGQIPKKFIIKISKVKLNIFKSGDE